MKRFIVSLLVLFLLSFSTVGAYAGYADIGKYSKLRNNDQDKTNVYFTNNDGYIYYKDNDENIYLYFNDVYGDYYIDVDENIVFIDNDNNAFYISAYGEIFFIDDQGNFTLIANFNNNHENNTQQQLTLGTPYTIFDYDNTLYSNDYSFGLFDVQPGQFSDDSAFSIFSNERLPDTNNYLSEDYSFGLSNVRPGQLSDGSPFSIFSNERLSDTNNYLPNDYSFGLFNVQSGQLSGDSLNNAFDFNGYIRRYRVDYYSPVDTFDAVNKMWNQKIDRGAFTPRYTEDIVIDD